MDLLSVLNRSDGTEKHSEGNCCADFTIAFAALRASKADVVIGHRQVLQLNIKLAAFPHHSGAVSVRNDGRGMHALCHNNALTDFDVVIEDEFRRDRFQRLFSKSDRRQISTAPQFSRIRQPLVALHTRLDGSGLVVSSGGAAAP